MSFDPPTSSDSQAYDHVQDADRVELIGSAVVTGTVDQGTGGASAWLVAINGVPHVVIDSGSVAVSNLPATQPVSGTVAVSAVAGTVTVDGSGHTQPVSGTVAVSNLPATQPVSGTVAVSAVAGTVTTDGSGHTQPVSGAVALSAGAAVIGHVLVDSATIAALTDGTQRVGGTVAVTQSTSPWVVDGSATVQPVSGTFFQATQPVSVASLPLPVGAALETTAQAVDSAVGELAFDSWLRFEETRWS